MAMSVLRLLVERGSRVSVFVLVESPADVGSGAIDSGVVRVSIKE